MGLCASSSASAASVAPVPPRSPPEPRSSSSAAALTEARTVTHGAAGVGIPVSPEGCLQLSPAGAGAGAGAAQSPPAPCAASPPEGHAAEALVAAAVGSGGAPAVLALMRAHPRALALQGWCCDALAGLMSGAAEVRAAAAGEGALALVLGALARFPYAEELQSRGCWVLAALAAGHAGAAGEGGALEACAAALRACPEAYTVLAAAVRAASNLVAAPPPAGPANTARAAALGLAAALKAALAAHPHDGQLQWRGQQLLGRLAAAAAAAAPAAAPGGEGDGGAGAGDSGAASLPAQAAARGAQSPQRGAAQRRPSLLAPLVMVLLPEHSAEAAPAAAPAAEAAPPAAPAGADVLGAMGATLRASQEANLPGREGPSLLVAQARQRGGVHELCMLLAGLASELEGETPGGAPDAREASEAGAGAGAGASARAAGARAQRAAALEASAETAFWCCDALSDAMRQDKSARLRAVLEDGVPSLFTLLRARPFDERLALACLMALQAIAGDVNLSAQVGLGIAGIVGALEANRGVLAVQQAGIKLISLLLLEPTGANLAAARASSAAKAVKAIVSAHAADAQLLYRGINILERLEAGSSADLPPQCMNGAVRSQSMRAEEAVREGQAAAASFVAAGLPAGGSSSFRESRRLGASVRGVGGLAQGLGRSSRSTLLPQVSSRRALDSTSSTVTSGELTTGPSTRLLQCEEGEGEEEAGREGSSSSSSSSSAPSGAPPTSAQVGVN